MFRTQRNLRRRRLSRDCRGPTTRTADAYRKVAVAQEMLGRVIHTTDNLDEKVGRIFGSMSFLAVGAVILYTSFLSGRLAYKAGGVDVVTLLFVAFMVAVAASTALMLEAMGPRFHLNPWGRRGKAPLASKPAPTGYADKIASMTEKSGRSTSLTSSSAASTRSGTPRRWTRFTSYPARWTGRWRR